MIYESEFFSLMRACMVLIPFIMWQLACLFLLCAMMLSNRISWVMLSLLVGVAAMLAVGYYERAQQWLVISRDGVVMHLGPGTAYPCQASLHALDRVHVLGSRDGWSQIEHNGVIGWIHNA